jgi:hypothetical protein
MTFGVYDVAVKEFVNLDDGHPENKTNAVSITNVAEIILLAFSPFFNPPINVL